MLLGGSPLPILLNYALTLEYLEAEFYRQGSGAGLLNGKEASYLETIGADEDAHVAAISDTIMKLGGTPVEAPGVDFGRSFANRGSYLETSHTFENLGVQAYLGAAGFIKDKAILQAAAGIFGVEARHAAVVGNLLGLEPEGGVYMGATETPLTRNEVLAAAKPFLAGAGAMSGDAAVNEVGKLAERRQKGRRARCPPPSFSEISQVPPGRTWATPPGTYVGARLVPTFFDRLDLELILGVTFEEARGNGVRVMRGMALITKTSYERGNEIH